MDLVGVLPKWLRKKVGGYLKGRGLAPVFDRAMVDTIWVDCLFQGAPSRDEVLAFMLGRGFRHVGTETQNDGRQENLTFIRASDFKGQAGK